MRICTLFLIFLLTPITLKADFVNYTFTGVIPNGASGHDMINDGESFVASFIVDTSTPDTFAGLNFGNYDGAVVSGSLEFSGGFASSLDFSAGDITVNDNNSQDSVGGTFSGDGLLIIAANQFVDLDTLSSDALPEAGVSFDPTPSITDSNTLQIIYLDDFGSVIYTTSVANNISFSATAIPEPTSVSVLFGLLLSCGARRRR